MIIEQRQKFPHKQSSNNLPHFSECSLVYFGHCSLVWMRNKPVRVSHPSLSPSTLHQHAAMPHETLENEQSSSFTEEKRKSHPDGKGKVHELAQWVQTNQKLTEHLVCAKCCGLYQIKMSSPKKKQGLPLLPDIKCYPEFRHDVIGRATGERDMRMLTCWMKL